MLADLTPEQALAFKVMDLLPSSLIPELAVSWLGQGTETPAIILLACEENPIMSEVGPQLDLVAMELGLPHPDRASGALVVLRYYLQLIVTDTITPFDGMRHIYNDVLLNVGELFPDSEHLGDGLGIERMCTWYRELQDAEDGSRLLYYNDLPRAEAVSRFRLHLIEEAKARLSRYEA